MITSAANPSIKHLQKLLKDRKYRYRQNQFAVEGYRQLEGARAIEALYVSSAAEMPELDTKPDRIHIVEHRIFERLADTENTQGVIAVCPLVHASTPCVDARYVLLDALQDPGNAGTIIRTAAAFGYGGVIFTPGCVDPFSPKVVRASMGAVFQCAIVLIENFKALRGCRVVAADLGGPDITAVQLDGPYILAIGNEARGISAGLHPWITQTVTIPFRTAAINSLNAAVAAGIVMYELSRQGPKHSQ